MRLSNPAVDDSVQRAEPSRRVEVREWNVDSLLGGNAAQHETFSGDHLSTGTHSSQKTQKERKRRNEVGERQSFVDLYWSWLSELEQGYSVKMHRKNNRGNSDSIRKRSYFRLKLERAFGEKSE